MKYFSTFILTAILLGGSCGENPVNEDNTLHGKLAFVNKTDRKLYVQDLDGANRQRVYLNNIEDNINREPWGPLEDSLWSADLNLYGPRWSPDGTKLAIAAGIGEMSELIVLDLAVGSGKVVSPNFFAVSSPDWSPDGSMITYSMSTSYWATFREIFVTDLETDSLWRITDLSGQVGNLFSPRWSEDGKKIFFTHTPPPDSLSKIYSYSFESDIVEIIASWPNVGFISRDGNMALGFHADDRIFRYNITDSQERLLSAGQDPRLIDSDRRIIFTHIVNQNRSVWLMTVNGEELQPLEYADSINSSEASQVDIWFE